ncbi:MAG: EamA family transporter [Coriobacteriia bacterium]|nr:EamA family transporter [Coriobacteriia bacterium]
MSGSHRLQGYSLALLAATFWATGGLTAKWLFTQSSAATASWPVPPLGIAIEPTALAGARALSAFLLMAVVLAFWKRDELRITPHDVPFLAIFGVVGLAMVHFTYFKTLSLANVATAVLLEYLAPVLVLVIGVAFMRHRFTWTLPIGVALSVGGSALVVGALDKGGPVVSQAGLMWGLLSAVFFAIYSLMGAVAASRFSPYTTLVWGLGFASIFWLVVLGPRAVLGVFADPKTMSAVLFMAVFSTIIPFTAFLAALKYIAPTNATVTSTVEPVIAGFGAFLLFGETLTLLQIAGGLLVIAAIIVVQLPARTQSPILPPRD